MKLRLTNWVDRCGCRAHLMRRNSGASLVTFANTQIAKAILVLWVLIFAAFIVWRLNLYFQVSRQLKAIRAAELPASPVELERWYARVPDSSNAAIPLVKAFELLKTFPDARSNRIAKIRLPERGKKWSPEEQDLVAEYVAMNAEALALAREAVQRPQCRYPIALSYGLMTDTPHLAGLKELTRIASYRAFLSAEQGRAPDWTQDIRLILQLACTLEKEPLLISQLLRHSLIELAAHTTERCLGVADAGDDLGTLIYAFEMVENTNALWLALVGERASAIPVFRLSWAEMKRIGANAEGGSPQSKPPPLAGQPNPLFWLSGLFERELNFFLQAMETNIALAALPPPASLVVTNLADEFTKLAKRRHYILSGLLLPTFWNAIIRTAGSFARIRLVRTALAIERFRAEHNRLPESLDELVPGLLPAVPADPFDGAPLRYRKLEKGYVVYSVDRDGQDDGGRERPADRTRRDETTYDITFVVER